MTRRRPPLPEERMSGAQRQMTPGTLDGWVRNTATGAAIGQAGSPSAGGSSSTANIVFARDRFEAAADGAQDVTLTYVPLLHSPHVYLNGMHLDEGGSNDYTRDSRTVSLLAAAGVVTGDLVDVRYAYYAGAPSTPTDPVEVDPILWWPFDETSGTTAEETLQSGTDMAFDGAVTWTASVTLPTGVEGEATGPTLTGLWSGDIVYDGALAQGVAIEFYVDGLQDGGTPCTLFEYLSYSTTKGVSVFSNAGSLGFSTLADGELVEVASVDASTPDGTRVLVRWEFDYTNGTSRVELDGVEEWSGTATFPFDDGYMFNVWLRGCDNGTRFDELRIWGGLSSIS